MSIIRGQLEHKKFLNGEKLTRKQAIMCQCYICNGENEGGEDCKGESVCPLYQYFPYKGKKSSISEAENDSFMSSQ